MDTKNILLGARDRTASAPTHIEGVKFIIGRHLKGRVADSMVPVLAHLMQHNLGVFTDWLEYMLANPSACCCGKADVMDAWLEWNGIIGYREKIEDMFDAVHGARHE